MMYWLLLSDGSLRRKEKQGIEMMEFIRNELKRGQQNILFGIPEEHSVQKEAGELKLRQRYSGVGFGLSLQGPRKLQGEMKPG